MVPRTKSVVMERKRQDTIHVFLNMVEQASSIWRGEVRETSVTRFLAWSGQIMVLFIKKEGIRGVERISGLSMLSYKKSRIVGSWIHGGLQLKKEAEAGHVHLQATGGQFVDKAMRKTDCPGKYKMRRT